MNKQGDNFQVLLSYIYDSLSNKLFFQIFQWESSQMSSLKFSDWVSFEKKKKKPDNFTIVANEMECIL